MVSQAFIDAVKAYRRTQDDLASAAKISSPVLSRLINKRIDAQPGDPGVLAAAEILGLDPSECFEQS